MTDTRARILAEATRQLLRVGYASFTVASVRDALGLSSGSMFHAFPSKPAVAASVYVEGMADYQRSVLAAIEKASGPERGLRAWIATHLGWIEEHRALAGYLFATPPEEVMAEAAGPLAERNAAFFAALERLFAQARSGGLMGRLSPDVARAICIGPAHEIGRQWTRGDLATPPRRLVRVLQDTALAALAATAPKPPRGREITA